MTLDAAAAAERRARMVAEQIERRGAFGTEVLEAMRSVPRERFVARELQGRAFHDGALAIAGGQTISQPYIVARMTQELDLPGWRARHGRAATVLDVGTGSGYQAAVLAACGADVVSIERHAELAEAAAARLAELGYRVEVVQGDGSEGYLPRAPYAGIVVAAAAPSAPAPLIDQLAPGGRMVLPIGTRDDQWLTVVERTAQGVTTRAIEPCVFVPLVGRHGYAGA